MSDLENKTPVKIQQIPDGIDPDQYAKDNNSVNFNAIPFGPFVIGLRCPDNVIKFLKEEGDKLEDLSVKTKLAGHLEKEHQYPEDIKIQFAEKMNNIFTGYREAHLLHYGMDLLIKQHGDKYEDFKPQMYLENLWINYMRENEFNPPHVHSGDLSFVIYLEVPSTEDEIKNHIANSPPPGWIQFMNEMSGNEATWKVTQQTFKPIEGDMYIFPASLNHTVFPYKTPGKRTSVSGNIMYTNRDKWPKYFF